jgi:hypothetical protein
MFSEIKLPLENNKETSDEAVTTTSELAVRYDYFIDENVIDSTIHQYFVGMRAHFAYLYDSLLFLIVGRMPMLHIIS